MNKLEFRMSKPLLLEVIRFHRDQKTSTNYAFEGIKSLSGSWSQKWHFLFFCPLFIHSVDICWFAKGEPWKTHWHSAIVQLYCCRYPLSLGVGCSASSLPEGCFPNHINEGAMLQPVLQSRRLCSRSSPIYTVPILIWQPWSRNRK